MNKKAKLMIVLDSIGFSTMIVGAVLMRFAKTEVLSVIGGIVLSIGVGIIGLSRVFNK